MAEINVLDKKVAELIAAGEVIERPSSVIKELVENSIDAKATAITVEIKNGGVTYMRVSDNGKGIEREDVKNAFLRHATSKIAQQDDLDSIATLGFRGEALASICAVSRVELITKSIHEIDGTLYKLDGGEETEFLQTGCPQGTTFIVRDLFYNVPARMKFLKKDVAESKNVSNLMDRIALSHPEISFTFIRDGRQVMKTMGNDDLETAIYQVFGKQFSSSLIPVSYEYQGIKLSGFISKPVSANRASRAMQMFFVNGRYVKTNTAMAALEQAYKGFIMVGKFPACVLKLEMNCSTLDVNVHPAKLEIRFTNERPVYECVYYGVKTALSSYDTRSSGEILPEKPLTDPKVMGPTADKGVQLGFSYSSKTKDTPQEPEVYMPKTADFGSLQVNDLGSAARAIYGDNVKITKINLSQHYSESGRSVPRLVQPQEVTDTSTGDVNIPVQQGEEETSVMPLADVKAVGRINENDEKNNASVLLPIDSSKDESISSDVSVESPDTTDIGNTAAQYVSENSVAIVDEDKRELRQKYIGEAFSSYIIIEYGENRLMFIDKHAAHERLIYERLKRQHTSSPPQLLLEPVAVTLDKSECLAVMECKEILSEAGFEVEEFGSGTILIRSVPLFLEKLEITEAFMEIAQYLKTHKKLVISEKMEWIYQNTACRAAIKAGNKNDPRELIELALELERNPEVRYCPHGRPIYFFLSKGEIEKNFKRI